MFGKYQNLISLQYNSAGLFRFLLVPIRGNDIVALVPTTTHFLYQSLGSLTDTSLVISGRIVLITDLLLPMLYLLYVCEREMFA